MSLADGDYEVPAGKLVEVVTYLQMTAPPALPEGAGGMLRRVQSADPAWYRALFRRVGEPWLWFARLELDDAALAAVLADPGLEIFAAGEAGAEIGLVELDRKNPAEVEIVYFGLVPEAVGLGLGRGLGRGLMEAALAHAWRPETRRVWLHTCQFDHPGAYRFYRRAGFTPYATRIVVGDDPRATGVLPREAAPQVPLVMPRG
jgi:GNAT superfamily N-acetyltransferase